MHKQSRDPSPEDQERLDELASRFRSDFLAGRGPAIEDYLAIFPSHRRRLLLNLVQLEIELRRGRGERPSIDDYRQDFPELDDATAVDSIDEAVRGSADQETIATHASGPLSWSEEEQDLPQKIGRYEIRKRLGRGGFGIVYLANDPKLERLVALKVPQESRLRSAEDTNRFVSEARAAANLKHPGLVAVYDVQEWEDRVFLVQEYIDGLHLGDWAKHKQPSNIEIARMFVLIAETIGIAHQEGFTHCDLKLANVLVDHDDQPHVADFGLAVHESARFLRRGERFGTPYSMAPEQVRGEGHRLDGRTDIWALGVMFYELLTHHRPFDSPIQQDLFDQILSHHPKPPRQWDRRISRELERICLKCLAKRSVDRYSTAEDFREDLLVWLESNPAGTEGLSGSDATQSDSFQTESLVSSRSGSSRSKPPIKVVPKGLRSFDDGDADFFLDLLPGPRDRDGLPESIRFWKKRIEEPDPESTFSVGLIYGPSGCGKSSFVKAGLIPKLERSILPIVVGATGTETESRLLKQLRAQVPQLSSCEQLAEACAMLRLGVAEPERKVLLVIDQFEQWLHANRDRENTELAVALRQVDGGRLQCILLVRDDFWMAVIRFLRELEVSLIEGHNLSAVDLFSELHARHVLSAFGRAFGVLPEDPSEMTRQQEDFIAQAVSELAENGRVISVRLALFAEMMKNYAWTPESLRIVEGARGVGEAFLEETLSSRHASPEHRYHEVATRKVLAALLPEVGTQIKGHMQSHDALAEASGYARDSREFADLLRILDGELRLITPVDPEGLDHESHVNADQQYYQLTHDYLVPSLRGWLTRKQRETRKGRAQLRLAELASAWNDKPESRNLPGLFEWLWLLTYARPSIGKEDESRMMSEATRRHLRRSGTWVLAAGLAMLMVFGIVRRSTRLAEQKRLDAAVGQLWTSEFSHLPDLINEIRPRRDYWNGRVSEVASDRSRSDDERTRAHLALATSKDHDLDYLVDRLVQVSHSEHQTMLMLLQQQRQQENVVPLLETRLTEDEMSPGELIRTVSALAALDGPKSKLESVAPDLVQALIRSDPLEAARWCDSLVTQHEHLAKELLDAFQSRTQSVSQRYLITGLISDIAQTSPQCFSEKELAEVAMTASTDEYSLLLPALRARSAEILPFFEVELDRVIGFTGDDMIDVRLARKASAVETLLRLGGSEHQRQFLEMLETSSDPRIRTRLISRTLEILGPQRLIELVRTEMRPSVRQALILSLLEGGQTLSDRDRDTIVVLLEDRYRVDPDAGVHAACACVLRRWGRQGVIELSKGPAQRTPSSEANWFVNGEGQVMVRLESPGEFEVGSPPWEPGRDGSEDKHKVRINYPFAISAHEVTVEQFQRFSPDFRYPTNVSPHQACPIVGVSWEDAMEYCQWLTLREAEANDSQNYEFEYSLPTVHEWEYAVRAGTVTSRFFGDASARLDAFAWYSVNSEERTHRVGGLMPNPWGLFDVYGNAIEWCLGTQLSSKPDRPVRGGHYRATPKFLRSAMNATYDRRTTISLVGFRVVRRPIDALE